ncbi:MAG TPA: N-acetylmuramoyl-L-alanine amidase, partial [Chloroflexota bacterium]|nr:N-acetylmuramoyl-L-alanine amidase [Chloroflexota bacterium]
MSDLRSTIPQQNYTVGREGHSVEFVVIHTTDGPASAAVARFQDPAQQVSAHYLVRLDGQVDYLVD